MRHARVKDAGHAYYHCVNRIIERRMVLGPEEKKHFLKLMRLGEHFCGLKVLTYAILGDHWHMLVEVPEREEVSDAELARRLGLLYSKQRARGVAGQLKEYRDGGEEKKRRRLREKYTYRMADISQFAKLIKQRFTEWYNRKEGRSGTLWDDRFKSILVEPSEKALTTMAAYIELNAVRAGLAEDPKDYRFCGYGEAVAGSKEAREGILRLMGTFGRCGVWGDMASAYREYLRIPDRKTGGHTAAVSKARVARVVADGGKLTMGEALRCRVRYFTDGLALGSPEFVDEVFKQHRDQFGPKRKTGARAMRWSEWDGLCTARALRLTVINAPDKV